MTVLALLLLLLTAGAQEPSIDVETWNVGLAYGFVDHAKQRRGEIFDALGDSQADVVCLQEAWEARDRRKIRHALGGAYPYQVVVPIAQTRTERLPACKKKQLFGDDRFVSCLTDQCGDTSGDARTDCIIEHCGPALSALKDENPECAQALMSQVGKSGLTAIINVLNPIGRPGVYAYDGSNGLVLISKQPLLRTGVVDFSDIATLNRRHAVYMDVRVGDATVRVYCTHVTADLSSIAPYPGPFDAWGDENAAQLERLVEHATRFDGPTVLMGDFNCGWADAGADLTAEIPAGCDTITEAGWRSPGPELQPQCTFCADNPLNAGLTEHHNVLIDHVFLDGLRPTAQSRAHDQPITIRVEGDEVQTALSDHYGWRVTATLGQMAPKAAPAPDPEPPPADPPTDVPPAPDPPPEPEAAEEPI